MQILWLLLALVAVVFPAHAQKLQPSTGIMLTAPTDGAGNACTSAAPCSNTTTPGSLTIVPLDVSTVTTGGTAVTALASGHRTKGGWLQNPPSAVINLCINEQGTATGTTSAGTTTCITPGTVYVLTPAAGAVSVISSDSSHPFSGMGWQ